MPKCKLMVILAAMLLFAAFPAHAYIGPGVGAGTIAVVLGILAAIVMAFFAVLWYPVKRILKKHRASRQQAGAANSEGAEGSGEA